MMSHAVSIIEKCSSETRCGFFGFNAGLDGMDSMLNSLKSFIGSPFFIYPENDSTLYKNIVQSIKSLLEALNRLYEGIFDGLNNWSDPDIYDQESQSSKRIKMTVLDEELDANDDSKDVTIRSSSGEPSLVSSTVNWKLNIISLISSFFSVLPVATWDVLTDLMRIESDQRVIYHFYPFREQIIGL